MYSGTTLRNKSGHLIGAHQKIDRVARRHLKLCLPEDISFPAIATILKFEGRGGPDGIKHKSPSRDEPWHYIDPQNPKDTALLTLITDHEKNLIQALSKGDAIRAAFEAAWLAHAITDGLTPAHHYPLEEKLEELRGGELLGTRTNFRKKVVMPGKNKRQTIRNNWEFWGAKGVMTTHFLFEMGISTTIATRGLKIARPSAEERINILRHGIRPMFLDTLARIDHLQMYQTFHQKGWTRALARQTHDELIPAIIRMVTLSWYYAAMKAQEKNGKA